MAAPLGQPTGAVTKDTLLTPETSNLENFNLILDHVIGEKKLKTNVFLPSVYGSAARSKQEQMIAGAFESCAFKAIASGVLGNYLYFNFIFKHDTFIYNQGAKHKSI